MVADLILLHYVIYNIVIYTNHQNPSPLDLPKYPQVQMYCLRQELEELKSKLGFTGFPVTAGGKMGQPLLGLVTKRDTDPWMAVALGFRVQVVDGFLKLRPRVV